MEKSKVLKIMLHPGRIRSHDNDLHFIGGAQLAHLYGVLRTDHVITYDPRNPTHREEWQKRKEPDRIHLYPDGIGDYYNVHEYDEVEVIRNKNIKL